jgi:hypothetical protein
MTTGHADGRAGEHRYYYAVAAGLAAVVFAGFARTYYLKGWFGEPPLSLLLHVHGLVMTVWYALFAVQVGLVASHRVALHRKLGMAGVGLAAVAVVLNAVVSLSLAKQRLLARPDSVGAPMLLGLQLFAVLLVFAILIVLGVRYRRRPDYHKRLMTLAMLSVLGPAVTRLPLSFVQNHDVGVAIVLSISIVVACIAVDTVRHRRLHPAFGWGGALVIGSIFVVAPLAQTKWWAGVTKGLVLSSK